MELYYWGGFSSPTVVDGIIYIGSLDGNVYALSALPTQFSSSIPTPTIIYGVIVIVAITTIIAVVLVLRKNKKSKKLRSY
jgi:outer membrane protein assembly factor BamB